MSKEGGPKGGGDGKEWNETTFPPSTATTATTPTTPTTTTTTTTATTATSGGGPSWMSAALSSTALDKMDKLANQILILKAQNNTFDRIDSLKIMMEHLLLQITKAVTSWGSGFDWPGEIKKLQHVFGDTLKLDKFVVIELTGENKLHVQIMNLILQMVEELIALHRNNQTKAPYPHSARTSLREVYPSTSRHQVQDYCGHNALLKIARQLFELLGQLLGIHPIEPEGHQGTQQVRGNIYPADSNSGGNGVFPHGMHRDALKWLVKQHLNMLVVYNPAVEEGQQVRCSYVDKEDLDESGDPTGSLIPVIRSSGMYIMAWRGSVNCRRRHGVSPGSGPRYSWSLRFAHDDDAIPSYEDWINTIRTKFGTESVHEY